MASYNAVKYRRKRRNQSQISEKKVPSTFMRTALVFRPFLFQVILVIITVLAITLLGLINPFVIRLIFDDAIGKGNAQLLLLLVGILILTPIISGVFAVAQTYLNNVIGQRIMQNLRLKLYVHLQNMSLGFFTSNRTGEVISRLSNDVSSAQIAVTDTATKVLTNVSMAISAIIAMLYLSPLLTVLSLGLLPIFLYTAHKAGQMRRVTSKDMQQNVASLQAVMQETLSVSGILLTKNFGRQRYTQELFDAENRTLASLGIRQQLIGRWFFMFINVFFAITPAIVYLISGWQIIHHTPNLGMSLGGIIAFTTLQNRLFVPLGQLLNVQVEIQGALALFDRIFEYLDLPIEIQDAPDPIYLSPQDVQGQVIFRDVSFTYRPHTYALPGSKKDASVERESSTTPDQSTQRSMIGPLSFTLQPGQIVALVGASGSGKTTLTYLLSRLYDVESGAVLIDGHNVKDIALDSLSELIGVVTQETYLFHDSIRKNLLYARPEATEEEMIEAAKAAAIHDRIMSLEHGYDTIVGERGYKVSGGEKQRIAIARVLLKNPRILVLDEATSSLDTQSEHLIQTALEPLMKQRTTLVIAHRLSTIVNADQIVVLDKGKIVERGTHQELLIPGTLYASLYQAQFQHTLQETQHSSSAL